MLLSIILSQPASDAPKPSDLGSLLDKTVNALPPEVLDQLVKSLTSPSMLMLAGTIWLVLLMFNKLAPAQWTDNPWYARLLPVLPEIIGVALTYVPGLMPPSIFNSPLLSHAVFGIWMGALSSKAHKVVSQSFLGLDDAIQAPKPADKPAPPPPNGI